MKRNMKKICILIFSFTLCGQLLYAQTYEEMVKKSYEYSDISDWPAAEECLKAAMRLEPANRLNFALLTNLGTIQRRQGKLENALISYSAALAQRPQDELILLNRAELYTEMDETEKAIYDYNTLIVNYPTHEQAHYNRGLLYIKTGEYLLAQTDFEFIIETYKDTFLGRFGYAILEKARGDYNESETVFNYLADKYPDNMRILEERAELYFLTKRNGRAMSDLNKVFAATTEPSAELYMLRGRVKLAQFEKEPAAVDFKRARDLGYDKETVDRLLKESF
ncbi:MAG: tetratricopeptide repeat protein [Tannerella sp.]|jgi:tetratricopeptide (TPR) repeat protein|nr:tetratricopeptide repeat protein [Tannerella sp.]